MGFGFIFDNLCVAVGVVALSVTRGEEYKLRAEIHRASKGISDYENAKEFLVGLVIILCLGTGVVALSYGLAPHPLAAKPPGP